MNVFISEADKKNEGEVIATLSANWGCEFYSFGLLFPVDYYAIRGGNLVGVIEIKVRSHPSAEFPTVFLSLRKWISLGLVQTGLGVPAVFVVRFTDRLMFAPFNRIDASKWKMGGRTDRNGGGGNDYEPMVLVDVGRMIPVNNKTRGM
ncbi:MAG: hypothetical protein M0R66_10370 [Candidatus Omnitrophica bacterium]|nr:hypothetical protein [Candidatus Omnitrophota bacterium]